MSHRPHNLAARLLLSCLLLALPALSAAASFDVAREQQSIGRGAAVLLDPERRLELADVMHGEAAGRFTPLDASVPSFGFANAAVWLRFTLVNREPEPVRRLLVIESSWLDLVNIWVQRPGGALVEHRFGDTLPYDAREVDHPLPVFPLWVPPGESTVYLRAESRDPLMLPLSLWAPERFAYHDRWTAHYYGLFYGVIAVMIVYNLFLLVFLRDRAYLYYVLYLAAFLAMNLTYSGFTYELLWRDHPAWVNWLHPITIYLYQIAGVLFAINFLATRQRNPGLHRFLLTLLLVLIASLASAGLVGGLHASVSLSISLVVIYTVGIVLAGVVSWYKGNRAARFFTIGSVSSLVGASITALVVAGLLPYHFAAFHAVEFGMMVDVTLLAMALADRYHLLRRERDLVEVHYRQSLARAKLQLQDEVAERTRELRTAKEAAENLARTDELTGINNRRAFYDYGLQAFNVARRHGHPASLIMVDLDHFKQVNDTWGHGAGDALLTAAADIIRHAVRNTDIVGRIGGEEFAIILPHTERHDAETLAEKLRAAIADSFIDYDGTRLGMTASFGVGEIADADRDVDDLIARADRALYAAKAAGRNRVEVA